MKAFWLKFLSMLVLISSAVAPAVAQTGGGNVEQLQRSVYLAMLLDNDPTISVLGAQSIGHFYGKDSELTDVIAELLLECSGAATRPQERSAGGYAAVLGGSESSRYFGVLTEARQKCESVSIQKHLDIALTKMVSGPGEQYRPGSVDVGAKRNQAALLMRERNEQAKSGFSGIAAGQSLAEVVTAVGMPNDITTMAVRTKFYRGQKLVFHYADAGLLLLDLQRGTDHWWRVLEPIDEPFPVAEVYSGEKLGTAQMLASLRGETFRLFLKLHSREFRGDTQLASVLVKRLETFSFPADRYEDDANAIALRLLWNHVSKEPSMLGPLRSVAASMGGKKGKKAAQNYLARYERRQAQLAAAAAAGVPAEAETDVEADSEDEDESLDENDEAEEDDPQ